MGTPITGKVVSEAIIPGNCAAPTAPATIICNPLCFAVSASPNLRFGGMCGVKRGN